jgi:hypothetical protein
MIELEWLVVFGVVVGWNEHGNPEVDIGEDSRRTKH